VFIYTWIEEKYINFFIRHSIAKSLWNKNRPTDGDDGGVGKTTKTTKMGRRAHGAHVTR
jgi:hypothetical protein